jgi:hypothetical protein
MKRLALFALCAGSLAGCFDNNAPSASPSVRLDPVLDSVFVGDQLAPPTVTYFDADGVPSVPVSGAVRWFSTDTTIVKIDSVTGIMTGRKRGLAIIGATVKGTTGPALIAVSNTLDLTLLLDTIYAMTGDTLTIPVAVLKKNSPPAADVWFESLGSGVFTVDSASGLITAVANGTVPYVAHADTVADTGTVSVMSLTDTTGGGKFFFRVMGTANSHVNGAIRGVNYRRSNDALAFRLRGTFPSSGSTVQAVQITLPDSLVFADSAYAIDAISLSEVDEIAGSQPTAICTPPRAWALWAYQVGNGIFGYSRHGGSLSVTQIKPLPSGNGSAISGQFSYVAQRRDLYDDPLGALAVRGTFVAPLVIDRTSCR